MAEPRAGGGLRTRVPQMFPSIRLRIDPAPAAMPAVTWRSEDESIVIARADSPYETTMRLPEDTGVTPAPEPLQTLLVPAPVGTKIRDGTSRGVTRVVAEIGAPVNERVAIPVYTTGSDRRWMPALTPWNTKIEVTPLHGAVGTASFSATIAYEAPVTSTYGTANALFTEVPWPRGTGGFFQSFGAVYVRVSPRPYNVPNVDWSIDGDAATIQPHPRSLDGALRLQGVHPGNSVLHAKVSAPVDRVLSVPLITYPTLVLPCRHGVRFSVAGTIEFTADPSQSDLFLDCAALRVPGGGVMLTNGNDPMRQPPNGALRGAQFPEVTASAWMNAFTVLDARRYGGAIEPCTLPESPGVAKIDYSCSTMAAHTLLFRTRDGRYVKWLLQIGNGFDVLAGPYQVL